MRILLIGGHITPLLAVASELKKHDQVELIAVARKTSIEGSKIAAVESELLQKMAIPTYFITTGRLQRKFTIHTIPSLLKLPVGFFQSLQLLRRLKPDRIVSFGGYLAVPICFTGWLLHVPIIIHEQTAAAGLANRLCARFARTIAISWESSRAYFPKNKTVVTGNPVRKEIYNEQAVNAEVRIFLENRTLPLLYFTGGNQGSHAINTVILDALEDLLSQFRVIHQTGHNDFSQSETKKASLSQEQSPRYLLVRYIASDDIGAVFHEAKLVISRAGANTVTELFALNKPAILIPIPWSQKSEQFENAKMLVSAGLATIIEQSHLQKKTLLEAIAAMMQNYDRYAHRPSNGMHDTASTKIAELIIAAS